MRLRSVALALALACGFTGLAEAKKQAPMVFAKKAKKQKKQKADKRGTRPKFKPGKAKAQPKFKPGKKPKNNHS